MYGYIYLTTNNINGKMYIGKRQSSQFDRNYKGSGVHLKSAFKLYGKENFTTVVLKECLDADDLLSSEKSYIAKYNAVSDPRYYNIAHGGDGGNTGRQYKGQSANHIQTDAEKQRRSESLKKAYAEGRHAVVHAGWKTGVKRTKEDVEANRLRNIDKVWVYKDSTQTTISKDAVNDYLSDGWFLGRLRSSKPVWNKGLTKETSDIVRRIGDIRKETLLNHSVGCCQKKNS